MIARFESGDVLLTTSISEIGGNVGSGVVPGNIAPPEFFSHGKSVEPGEFSGLCQCDGVTSV
jgi:hypothetical protein